MAVYRIYLVHDDGRLQPDESFYCKTDEEAVSKLRRPLRQDVRVELWQGGRFVAVTGYAHRPGDSSETARPPA